MAEPSRRPRGNTLQKREIGEPQHITVAAPLPPHISTDQRRGDRQQAQPPRVSETHRYLTETLTETPRLNRGTHTRWVSHRGKAMTPVNLGPCRIAVRLLPPAQPRRFRW